MNYHVLILNKAPFNWRFIRKIAFEKFMVMVKLMLSIDWR